ncbi:SDR family oxidoreductase [Methylomonas sp. EFPC3]|uniref:SDR family oxidoreductase n=1 Tax=Methylomonas sp. EFPC3 TaxID=3021710 RepID=UPI002415A489|nr:SDR family oxidoreductase [Methylomonas sp. EFPC3]WFP52125.1 SDR family oxidoreductase [Methylomonas sp. EFPC3]
MSLRSGLSKWLMIGLWATSLTASADKILVAGATGGTGQHIVHHLLQQGQSVRIFARDADKVQRLFGSTAALEIQIGDIRDPQAVAQAVQGVTHIISAVGARSQDEDDPNSARYVDYEGTQHLVKAAQHYGVQQIILVSSAGLSDSVYAESVKNRPILLWKKQAEQAVQSSGIPYSLVRPGRLLDEDGGQFGIRVTQGDYQRVEGIARNDVARVCVAALNQPAAYGKTFEITGDRSQAPVTDWPAFFQAMRHD